MEDHSRSPTDAFSDIRNKQMLDARFAVAHITSKALTELAEIAVGTALAGGPPRRSQRALLTHWAPALGLGVEPLAWEGMHHAGGW